MILRVRAGTLGGEDTEREGRGGTGRKEGEGMRKHRYGAP